MVKQDKTINITDCVKIRYIIKNENFGKFEATLMSNMNNKFNCQNKKEGLEKIEQVLCNKINFYEDVDKSVNTVFSCITAAWSTAFTISREGKHLIKKATVSCWAEELTVLRKRTNYLRKTYQTTTNNEHLRQDIKKYFDGRSEFEIKM
jgi:hypothetical protein